MRVPIALNLLSEREIDIDFDGGFGRPCYEFPLVYGVFRGSGEHVIAADGLGCGDAAIGRDGGGYANHAADAHALGQFGIGGGDALLDGAVGVVVRGAKRQRYGDCECEDCKSSGNLSRFLERVLEKMPAHSNHPGAKSRLISLSADEW